MRAIDADTLYEKLKEDEDLARQRVIDTSNSFPNGSLNPSAIRYMAQLSERTRFKEMIYDAPTIEPERKKGKWIDKTDPNWDGDWGDWECTCCGSTILSMAFNLNGIYHCCPFCGADMVKEGEEHD